MVQKSTLEEVVAAQEHMRSLIYDFPITVKNIEQHLDSTEVAFDDLPEM